MALALDLCIIGQRRAVRIPDLLNLCTQPDVIARICIFGDIDLEGSEVSVGFQIGVAAAGKAERPLIIS